MCHIDTQKMKAIEHNKISHKATSNTDFNIAQHIKRNGEPTDPCTSSLLPPYFLYLCNTYRYGRYTYTKKKLTDCFSAARRTNRKFRDRIGQLRLCTNKEGMPKHRESHSFGICISAQHPHQYRIRNIRFQRIHSTSSPQKNQKICMNCFAGHNELHVVQHKQ